MTTIIRTCVFSLLAWSLISGSVYAADLMQIEVKLDGAQCTPPVNTKANGLAQLSLNKESGEISGMITLKNIDAKKAHIHYGETGKGGKVLVNLEKSDAGTFVVPDFTTLAKADVDTLLKGGMYLQVHTAQYPKGELRGQIMP
ncbi:MAG: CHRD domain-containing protein [Gammaproteobacteria bacterium]|nr:CHRD domain-containing protein [Gammaproteobacteria bacterium]